MAKKKEMKHEMHSCDHCYNKSPFIAIPSSLGGIFLGVVVMFLIFARESAPILGDIIWGFVVLGIVAMWFASRSKNSRKK